MGDEGWFNVGLTNSDLAEFIADTLPNSQLDPIPGAPLNEQEIYDLKGRTFCAKVGKSDVSNLDDGKLNAQGAYMGLTAFRVIAVTANSEGGGYLPDVTVDLFPSTEVQNVCQSVTSP